MAHQMIDTGISRNIGTYSDAVVADSGLRWLYTAGTPGITKDGSVPQGIEAQTRQAFANVIEALAAANMTIRDIVKIVTSLSNSADKALYVKTRKEILGDVKPAFMLAIVNELIKPEYVVEIEVIAAAK